MENKHDKDIDYEQSGQRHSPKCNNGLKLKIITTILVFMIGIGIAAFEGLKPKTYADNNGNASSKNQAVTLMPTVIPTTPPAKAATNDKVQYSPDEVMDLPETIKGIYVPAKTAGTDSINKLINIAETTEINAMVIDVKDDHGKITYAMDCDLAKRIGAVTDTITNMDELVKALKARKIYLIARIVAFKDPCLAAKRTDLAIKNKDGSIYRDTNGDAWVNPYNKEVWNYLVDVASHAVGTGFDEIQFDYIRFSTGNGIAKADFGKEAENKTKEQVITEFTRYLYHKLKPLGVNVSADVYGAVINSNIDAGLVGQNYVEMSKYLDYICPMIYPSHFGNGNYGVMYPDLEPYNIIHKVMLASKSKLDQIPDGKHHAVVRPWLQDFTATWLKNHKTYGGPELRQEIKGVYSAGYGEWLLWNNSCQYSVDGLLKE